MHDLLRDAELRSAASATKFMASRLHQVGQRRIIATPVLASYWRLACERQQVYFRRLEGRRAPWTSDPVVQRYRFTNAYRAADRVSQTLIHVQYDGPQTRDDIVFRTMLFRFFNKTDTWALLERSIGPIAWESFDLATYVAVLDQAMARGERVYSAAYILPPPPMGAARKHENHMRLIRYMMTNDFPARLCDAASLQDVYRLIGSYPSLGPFLSFQLAIDLNYTSLLSFDEDDFVVAGPGARSGIAKCFADTGGLSDADVVRWMADTQEDQCDDFGLDFRDLFGRKLKLIDCQNLFCETDKYARVAHPDVSGIGGRTRIKQEFAPAGSIPAPVFPPRWGLSGSVDAFVSARGPALSA